MANFSGPAPAHPSGFSPDPDKAAALAHALKHEDMESIRKAFSDFVEGYDEVGDPVAFLFQGGLAHWGVTLDEVMRWFRCAAPDAHRQMTEMAKVILFQDLEAQGFVPGVDFSMAGDGGMNLSNAAAQFVQDTLGAGSLVEQPRDLVKSRLKGVDFYANMAAAAIERYQSLPHIHWCLYLSEVIDNVTRATGDSRFVLFMGGELKAAGVPVEQFREITQETFEGMLEQVSEDDQRAIVMMGLVDAFNATGYKFPEQGDLVDAEGIRAMALVYRTASSPGYGEVMMALDRAEGK